MIASLWFSRITPSFNWLLRLVGAKNHNIPTAPRKEPGSPNSASQSVLPKENSETPHGSSRRFHTSPVHGFNNRVHVVSSAGWHVFLSVSHNGFGVDPHACRKSCTHPILLFISYIPTSNSIHDGSGVWEFRLWDQVGQVDPILHMGCPVLFRNIFSRSPCHGTNLGLLQPSSSCLFIEQYVLFLPFIFIDRRYPVHSWPPINGAGSKYKKKKLFIFLKQKHARHYVSHALGRRPEGQNTHSSGDTLPSFSLLWLLYPCIFFNFDPLVRLRSHVYLLISSMHRFHVFHTDFPNDRSQIQGRTLTPEFSLDLAVQSLQWYTNFTGCDPHVLVHTFDHNTTSTSSICLSAVIPKTSNCRPLLYCVPSQS